MNYYVYFVLIGDIRIFIWTHFKTKTKFLKMAVTFSGEFVEIDEIPERKHSVSKEENLENIDIPQCVNILVLGKVGVGKARIMNYIFQELLFETKAFTTVIRRVSEREKQFIHHGIQFNVKMYDTLRGNYSNSRICIAKTMSCIRKYVAELYPQGINLILLVCRQGNHLCEEIKRLKYILHHLNKDRVPLITAFILNGCDDCYEEERLKILSNFDSTARMQMISQFSLQGVYATSFVDLQSVSDGLFDMYRTVNVRDAKVLNEIVQNCCQHQVVVDGFFSLHNCKDRWFYSLPWSYCMCYSHIYKCWKWGYSWNDCIQTKESEY